VRATRVASRNGHAGRHRVPGFSRGATRGRAPVDASSHPRRDRHVRGGRDPGTVPDLLRP